MHVTARAPLQRQPFFRHSLGPPVGDPISALLRPSPTTGDRRSSEIRTRFSKPLAYPSTLDRLPAPYVEGLWSPMPRTLLGNLRQKHTLIHQRDFQRRAPRVFLSQAGPRFDLGLLQAEHHLWFRRLVDRLQKRRRRPVGSPSAGLRCG